MKKFFPVIVLFFVFLFAGAQTISAQNKIEFTEYKLKNGLHVILHQDNSKPVVAITVTYHVGSKNEDPTRTGFAHFFEHLMFEGSENIKRGEFDKIVQNAGANYNAYTSFDETVYYLNLPSNQIELGLWIESERMLHAKIDEVGIETQRNVVKEEKRQRIDNQPYGTLLEKMFANSFTVHPYRWMPIGSFQYIDQASMEEFINFYETFYVPNNAVLSIAGDFNINDVKKLIENYFGEIPQGTKTIPRPEEVEPKKTAEVREVVYDNVQLDLVAQGYHIPAKGTEDYYALEMLATLLTGGESSRLIKEIVDKQQKAVFLSSYSAAFENPGLYIVYAVGNSGVKADELDKLLNEEIAKVQNELISENEFQKLRNQIENDFFSGNNRMFSIALNLAQYHLFFGDADLINKEIERYMKVTREDIQNAAKKYLTEENRTVLYYLPKSAKEEN